MRNTVSIALVFTLGACYQYVPISETVPKPGQEVRAHFSNNRDFDVGSLTIRDVTRVDGIVYTSTADTVVVYSSWLYQTFGRRYDTRRAVYYLSLDELGSLEERRFNPLRSAIGVGLGVGAFASIFTFVAEVGGDPSDGDGKGDIAQQVTRPFR